MSSGKPSTYFRWGGWALLLLALFALRLAFGLWAPPVQPVADELQTTLIGLKYYATGAWPYYGNDVVLPPQNAVILTQDPGPLEAFLIGLPWKLWPSPLAPFLLLNLLSLGGLCLLGIYALKRLPHLPPLFVIPWVLTAPWCLHYSTGLINLSYTVTFACYFFVALLESTPSLSLGWISLPWANILTGIFFSAWVQFHRTWVLVLPLLAISFFLQWRSTQRWYRGPLFFLLGASPLLALIAPTLLLPGYHFFRDASGFSYGGFNPKNFIKFFGILAQFFAMVCYEMLHFLGIHTADRIQFLSQNNLWVLATPLFVGGCAQVLALVGFLAFRHSTPPCWAPMKKLILFAFFFTYFCLLFTSKSTEINTFCEMLPLVMLYSIYVWGFGWKKAWVRVGLWFILVGGICFQVWCLFAWMPEKGSFYAQYGDTLNKAIVQKDDHLLGERRPGYLY